MGCPSVSCLPWTLLLSFSRGKTHSLQDRDLDASSTSGDSQGFMLVLAAPLPALVESFISTPVSPPEAASLIPHLPPRSSQPEFLHPLRQVITTIAITVIAYVC